MITVSTAFEGASCEVNCDVALYVNNEHRVLFLFFGMLQVVDASNASDIQLRLKLDPPCEREAGKEHSQWFAAKACRADSDSSTPAKRHALRITLDTRPVYPVRWTQWIGSGLPLSTTVTS